MKEIDLLGTLYHLFYWGREGEATRFIPLALSIVFSLPPAPLTTSLSLSLAQIGGLYKVNKPIVLELCIAPTVNVYVDFLLYDMLLC